MATDDERIVEEINKIGGKVILTSNQHNSGTDRCAEAVTIFAGEWDAVINIQGDEPFIFPEQIDLLASLFDKPEIEIGTLVKN